MVGEVMADKNTVVQALLLSDIHVDHTWNARSGGWQDEKAREDGSLGGIDGLRNSIKARGQDDAVIVRPNPNKAQKKPYSLVTGYRRCEAIGLNAVEAGDKAPTIRAIVRELSEFESRALNIRENTARDDLKGADLAWSIGQMLAEAKSNGVTLTGEAVAIEIGKHQTYVAKLIRVLNGVKASIFKAWRESPVSISVSEMDDIAKLPKEEQEKSYEEASRGKEESKKKSNRILPLKKAADRIGMILGRLVQAEYIEVSDFDFNGAVDVCVKLPKGDKALTAGQRKQVVDSLKRGFTAGTAAPKSKDEDEEDEDEDEEDSE